MAEPYPPHETPITYMRRFLEAFASVITVLFIGVVLLSSLLSIGVNLARIANSLEAIEQAVSPQETADKPDTDT